PSSRVPDVSRLPTLHPLLSSTLLFYFIDTATTTLSTLFPTRRSSDLRAANPGVGAERIDYSVLQANPTGCAGTSDKSFAGKPTQDRKSTRLNSSHVSISYAVFCLKKKNKKWKHFV